MSELAYEPRSDDGPDGAPYPGYVVGEAERERWDVCHAIVSHLSGLMEGGEPDQRFVWVGTRALYNSDTPTGDLDGEPVEEAEAPPLSDDVVDVVTTALELPDDIGDDVPPTPEELRARVRALEDSRPAEDAPDDEWWAWVGRMADSLDALLGGSLDGAEELEEASLFDRFRAEEHPRNRIGKWVSKLGGVRAAAVGHREAFRHRLGVTLAAAKLKREVARSDKEGRPLHGKLRHAGVSDLHLKRDAARIALATKKDQADVEAHLHAVRLRSHAREERNRSGLRGRRQEAIRDANIAGGLTLSTIHKALTVDPAEIAEREARKQTADKSDAKRVAKGTAGVAGTYEFDPRQTKDIHGAPSTWEDVKLTAEKAMDVTRWAHDHGDALKLAGHAARSIGRAKGLALSSDEPEDEADALYADLVHTV